MPIASNGQNAFTDSLNALLQTDIPGVKRVDILNNLAFEYRGFKGTKYKAYLNEADSLSRVIEYDEGLARSLNIRSFRLIKKLSDFPDCIAENKAALQLVVNDSAHFVKSKIQNTIAYAYYIMGDFDLAHKHFLKALRHTEIIGDLTTTSTILGNLGILHTKRENFELAENYLDKLNEIAQKDKNQNSIYTAFWRKGLLYENMGRHDDAIKALSKAREIATGMNKMVRVRNMSMQIAQNHIMSGRHELAKENIYPIINKKTTKSLTVVRGKYWLALSDFKQKKYYNAQRLAQNAYNLSLEKDVRLDYRDRLLDLIAKSAEKTGNYRLAYEFVSKQKNWRDSMALQDKSKRILELESKYQVQQKELENKVLKAEQAQKDAKISQHRLGNILGATGFVGALLFGYLFWQKSRKEKEHSILLENKVSEKTNRLVKANEHLTRSNEELERFAYITSHDLKEPIRNINSFTALAKKHITPKNEKAEEYLGIIRKNANRMSDLINNTLEFTKLGHTNHQKDPVDSNKIVKQTIELFNQRLKAENGSIEIKSTLPIIYANENKIAIVFKNLIENGLKYNKSVQPKIEIDCNSDDSKFHHYTVADNGIGIEEKYHDQVFEMFARLHTRDQWEGDGLGLSFCKRIVEEHGGSIWLEDNNPSGSIFHFTVKKE